jgi:hypothetical protein
LSARRGGDNQRPLRRWQSTTAAASITRNPSAVPGEIASMRFTGDTIAVFVCAVSAVGVAISFVGLIGCEIIALLTRRH